MCNVGVIAKKMKNEVMCVRVKRMKSDVMSL